MSKKFLLITVFAILMVFVASTIAEAAGDPPATNFRNLRIGRYDSLAATTVDKVPKISCKPVTGNVANQGGVVGPNAGWNVTHFFRIASRGNANAIVLPAFGIGERNGDTAGVGGVLPAMRFHRGDTIIVTFASVLSHKYPKFRFTSDSGIIAYIYGGENLRVHPLYRMKRGSAFYDAAGTENGSASVPSTSFLMRAAHDSALVLVVDSATIHIGDDRHVGANGDSLYFVNTKVLPADTAITQNWNNGRCDLIDTVVVLVKRATQEYYSAGEIYQNNYTGLVPIEFVRKYGAQYPYYKPSAFGLASYYGFQISPQMKVDNTTLLANPPAAGSNVGPGAPKYILTILPGNLARLRWGDPWNYGVTQELYFGPAHRWNTAGMRGGVDTMVVGGNVGVDTLALIDQYRNIVLDSSYVLGVDIKFAALDSCSDRKYQPVGPLRVPTINGFILRQWSQVKDCLTRNTGLYLVNDWSFTKAGTWYVRAYVAKGNAATDPVSDVNNAGPDASCWVNIINDTTFSSYTGDKPGQQPLVGTGVAGMPLNFLPGAPYEMMIVTSLGDGFLPDTVTIGCPRPTVCFNVAVADSFKNAVLPFRGRAYSMTVFVDAPGGQFAKAVACDGFSAKGLIAPLTPSWRTSNEKTDSIQVLLDRGTGFCINSRTNVGEASFSYTVPGLLPKGCKVCFTFQIDSLWGDFNYALNPDPLFATWPYSVKSVPGYTSYTPNTLVYAGSPGLTSCIYLNPGPPINIVLDPDSVVDYVTTSCSACVADTVNMIATLTDCWGNPAGISDASKVTFTAYSSTFLKTDVADKTGYFDGKVLITSTDACSASYSAVKVVYHMPTYVNRFLHDRCSDSDPTMYANRVAITAYYISGINDISQIVALVGTTANADLYVAKYANLGTGEADTTANTTWMKNGWGAATSPITGQIRS